MPQEVPQQGPIGSGQVEGSVQQVVMKRLKQTGTRWRVEDVNRMAVLTCLANSADREACGNRAA